MEGLLRFSGVESFQGREKEVIINSLVRVNDAGKVGFLKDNHIDASMWASHACYARVDRRVRLGHGEAARLSCRAARIRREARRLSGCGGRVFAYGGNLRKAPGSCWRIMKR